MSGSAFQPAEQPTQYAPAAPPPIVFEGFTTLNTQASRPGVSDTEMSWCDGFMPIGKNNLRVLPGPGMPIYSVAQAFMTWINNSTDNQVLSWDNGIDVPLLWPLSGPPPTQIVWYDFGNIGATPYCIAFLNNGSIIAINTNSMGVQTIAAPGTITNPAIVSSGISQWASEYIIIVANQPNGYWLWDGSVLFGAGSVTSDVTVTNGGSGYSANPVVTASSGSGSGTAFAATVVGGVIVAIAVINAGSGYLSGETVTLTITDSTGTGATAVLGTDGSGSTPSTPTLMPFGVSGTMAETYQNRVFIINGSRLQISAPGSPSNFSAADGGDLVPANSSYLRVGYTDMIQTNGFLYLIADSAIDYISGLTQSTATPPVLTVQRQNANPEIGTPWPEATATFGQAIVLANPSGVYLTSGGAVDKISDMLDGIYNSVPGFAGVSSPSVGKAIIYGRRVVMVLLPVIDKLTGSQENKLLMTDGRAWWTSGQGIPLIYIKSQEINSVLTAYGTDGTSIYPLFQAPSNSFTKRAQSKLFETKGYEWLKAASRLWGLVQYNNIESPVLNISIDNESGVGNTTVPINPTTLTWFNNSGQLLTWIDNSSTHNELLWGVFNAGVFVIRPTSVAQNGALIGMTITTNAADMSIISMKIGVEDAVYRA